MHCPSFTAMPEPFEMMLSVALVLELRPLTRFCPPCDERVLVQTVAVEVFFPLIGKNAADRADSCLDESHKSSSSV